MDDGSQDHGTIWMKVKIYAMMLQYLKRYMTMPANKTFKYELL
jgi:hypothetical protein